MAAIRQQGAYLTVLLTGFTAFAAGLAMRASLPALGVLIALVGLGLLIYSAVGFYRIKS
jgi:hypothetical protein